MFAFSVEKNAISGVHFCAQFMNKISTLYSVLRANLNVIVDVFFFALTLYEIFKLPYLFAFSVEKSAINGVHLCAQFMNKISTLSSVLRANLNVIVDVFFFALTLYEIFKLPYLFAFSVEKSAINGVLCAQFMNKISTLYSVLTANLKVIVDVFFFALILYEF